MKYSSVILSQLFILLMASFACGAEDDVLIQPPLSWSINSVRIVWSVSEGTTAAETAKFIYSSEQSKSQEEGSNRTSSVYSQTGRSTNTGSGGESSGGLNSNPFELFGLFGMRVKSSRFMDIRDIDVIEIIRRTSDEWSESEKEMVAAAFSSSSELSTQRTVSNRKLVFTVDFVNHTEGSRLIFDPTSANSVPVFCGEVHLGNAKLVDARSTIAATGMPIPCQFEMPLDDTGKMAILKHNPKISIGRGQLLIRTSDGAREPVNDAIQESIVSGSYFTVAINSEDLIAHWSIRRFSNSPVTLKEALEAINEQIRAKYNDDEKTLFRIDGETLAEVCNVSLAPKSGDKWGVHPEYVKSGTSRVITNWPEELKSTPGRGAVFAFYILKKRIADLTALAASGDAQAQYDLAACYETGDDVEKNWDEAIKWYRKAAEGGNAKAKELLEDLKNPFTTRNRKAGDRAVTTIDGVKFAFRWCPAGTFTMGSPESEEGREPVWSGKETQHRVTLTKGFWIQETEVTQAQWKAIMGTTIQEQVKKTLLDDTEYEFSSGKKTWRVFCGYKRDKNPDEMVYGVGNDYSIYYVNWNESVEFCRNLSSKLGMKVQLPTEAQWEYACRAGTQSALYNGDLEITGMFNSLKLDPIAWYGGNSSVVFSQKSPWDSSNWSETQYPGGPCGTHPVGKKDPNAWGLYDMTGNVWEWCSDWYEENTGCNSVTDPKGPESGSNRVYRGGGWSSPARNCRSAIRDGNAPERRFSKLGFRLSLGQ